MIPSTPQIIIESRSGNIILEPMRMAKLKAFSDAVLWTSNFTPPTAPFTY